MHAIILVLVLVNGAMSRLYRTVAAVRTFGAHGIFIETLKDGAIIWASRGRDREYHAVQQFNLIV